MRIPHKSIIAAIAVFGIACGDAGGPLGNLTLCPSSSWAGIQRQGQPWQTISGTRTRISLEPDERIGLARIKSDLGAGTLQIYYVTAAQAEDTFSCEAVPTKELQGNVHGGGTDALTGVEIAIGNAQTLASTLITDFTLAGVPDGQADLVASLFELQPLTIIRRGVDYANHSTIPLLDFSSGEQFSLVPNTLNVTGTDNIGIAASTWLLTSRGTLGALEQTSSGNGSSLTIHSVPEARLVSGDLHVLNVLGSRGRHVTHYFRLPADQTVDLGPFPSAATIVATPAPSLRIDQPSQPEYGSQIRITICLPASASSYPEATIVATKEYFGATPTTWSITFPDMLSVAGFPSGWPDFRGARPCEISVTDKPYLFSPASVHDGDTYRMAAF